MKSVFFWLAFVLTVGLASPDCWAGRAYVTDTFKVTLRSGPSTENRIIAMLSSAQEVEVLEDQGDWSRVRVPVGGDTPKEGWTLSRYLLTRMPWELQTEALRKENASLKEKQSRIDGELSDTAAREKVLSDALQAKTRALEALREEYESLKEGASSYLKLRETHRATQSALETAKAELKAVTDENRALRTSQRNKWFATGALVLLCGLMIGLVTGRQQRKRRSSYY